MCRHLRRTAGIYLSALLATGVAAGVSVAGPAATQPAGGVELKPAAIALNSPASDTERSCVLRRRGMNVRAVESSDPAIGVVGGKDPRRARSW